MLPSALVFDLDGTLIDSLEDIADATNEVLESRGYPTHPLAPYRHFVGDGVYVLYERTLPAEARVEPIIRACIRDHEAAYGRHWNLKTGLYDGIAEMLDELVARRIPITVLSNKPHAATLRCVEEFLARWKFDLVLGQRDGVARKPDPAGAIEICERLGFEPGNVLYMGDTSTDMLTAARANMIAVGVTWGFREQPELEDAGARHILHHPSELWDVIKKA